MIEDLSGLPAEVDSSSEFRYRNFHVDEKTLVISIGQSGETADTLAAMAAVKEKGGKLITVCNVEDSQATRLAQGTLYMRAGPEIGVASTKTFIASLAVLLLTSIFLGRVRGEISDAESRQLSDDLGRLPHFLDALLEDHAPYERLAKQFYRCEHFLYLRKGHDLPDSSGRRLEAEGDQLYPCRGVPGRRDETRSHRLDRRKHAGRGAGARRPPLQQDGQQS